jgi:2-keto-4-pentenoate hydratase/2-oxohepta-3-ene-1,7-dioic acid hydratase in catechol pathway
MRLITFEDASSVRFAVAGARLLAPIPEPAGDVLAVGRNYREHAQEFTESGFDASGKAGDLIATGTGPGVGIGFDPPHLESGDVVEINVDRMGMLSNPVE